VVEELWSNHCQGNLNFKLAQLLNQMAKSCGSFWNISLLISSIQFMHHISLILITKILHFSFELNLKFGGKSSFWELSIFHTSIHLHLVLNNILRWIQHALVYCSIISMHMRVDYQFAHTLASSLIIHIWLIGIKKMISASYI
jgi:hypothetical protein